MKYFTKDWCFSNLDDDEIEKRLKNYRTYIHNVYKKLPFVLKNLIKTINFHDGKLEKVSFIQNKRTLILKGVFGDLEVGYYFLEVKYLKVSNLEIDFLDSVFKNQEIEILSDEIEVLNENLFSHKILFSTKQDINIQFQDIKITIQNAKPKDYKKLHCHLKII